MHSRQFIEHETNTHQVNFVLDFFNKKRNGFFIELGAVDGVCGSNTYKLEMDYGWSGILIEPLRDYHELISQYRKQVRTYNICVGNDEDHVDFTRIEGCSKVLSGISKEYPSRHIDRINREVQSTNQQVYVERVRCMKMISILKECGVADVDYLSVDVEGAELSVIKSLSMETENIRPTLIATENNYGETNVEHYLCGFGYSKLGNFGGDDFYCFGK